MSFTKADFMVTNKQLIEQGLADEFTPPIVICEFCGKELVTLGLKGLAPFTDGQLKSRKGQPKETILWRGEYKGYNHPIRYEPERCNCPQARGWHYLYDKENKVNRELLRKEREEKAQADWINRLFARSEIKTSFPGMTLESLTVGPTQPPEQAEALRKCKYYIDNYKGRINDPGSPSHGKGLYFSGSVGTGKTHLAIGTLHALTATGVTTLAIRSGELFNRLRETYNAESKEKEQVVMTLYTTVDILLIDDLGKERPTDWSMEKLYQIIEARYMAKRPIFITCNYTDEELIARLTPKDNRADTKTAEAIVSRLRGCTSPTVCGNLDYRRRR